MTKAEIAIKKFPLECNCAQAVLLSFADSLNLDIHAASMIATGFGGGMGRKQEVCGAVSGAIMVLGLVHGRGINDAKEKQDLAYAKVREFIDLFTQEFGTINCSELLSGCVLMTPEGQQRFKDEKLIEKCREYVRRSVEILEKTI